MDFAKQSKINLESLDNAEASANKMVNPEAKKMVLKILNDTKSAQHRLIKEYDALNKKL